MTDEMGLVPPSQDVADKIVEDIVNRLTVTLREHPLTVDQNWALAAITNKVTQKTVDEMNQVENGLSVQIMKIAQYAFLLGQSYANQSKPGTWRSSGEMRSYD